MDQIELRALEARCIQEEPPPCQATCPVHVDARALAGAVGKGDFAAGLAAFRRAIPFPQIVARICDEPCRPACTRGKVGDPIQIRELELACVCHSDPAPEKPRQLPRRKGRVAVVGGGLSGLTAAHDLARKGYGVTLYEAEPRLGGDLRRTPPDDLPPDLLEADLAILHDLGVDLRVGEGVAAPTALRHVFDAVYVATGAPTADLPPGPDGALAVDPVTFAAGPDGVFAGGAMLRAGRPPSPITAIADGRRAAISIDRYLQRVSLTASRAGEGALTTRLFTSTAGVAPLPAVHPARPADGFERAEAVAEAGRCLLCECMECVKVCPYLEHYDRYPRKGIREVYNNLSIVQGERKANRFINSCSLCGLCAEVCPTDLSMGAVCKDARQTMVRQNRMPPSAHDFALRDMAFSNSPQFALARHQPGTTVSAYVFFPGCQLSASTPGHVERVYADLCRRMGAPVGLLLRCCGVPADWAGRADLFEAGLAELRGQLRALGDPTVILPCSSCYQSFKTNLPEVPILSLWELYATWGVGAWGREGGAGAVVAVHDPCSTRYEAAIQEGARAVAEALGYTIEELPLSRARTTCCSYGGNQWLANPEVARKVVERRVAESPRDYVTYCAMCRDFFAARGKRALHLLDIVYGDDGRDGGRGPGFSQRHENRARLRRKLLTEVWGEPMEDQASYDAITLFVPDEVRARLEERHILDEDIRRVLHHAGQTGARFFNQATGRWLASFRPTAVTYWVEYVPQDDGFLIVNAYSHRMEIVEDHSS